MIKKSSYIKLFSYGTLYERDVQMREFGQEFYVEDDVDYITGYDIEEIQIGKNTYKILVESPGNKNIILGAIIYVPKSLISKVDEYEGDDYKRVEVRTLYGNNCQLYIKN